VGLVGISAIIQLGGLGVFIFDGYATQFTTKVIVGSVLSIALAVALDAGFHVVEAALTPWTRRGQAS
jgi:ABC-type proline/glycine betaine transport system permease subunit